MYYTFNPNLYGLSSVKILSASDDYSAIREFEIAIQHLPNDGTLELCKDGKVLVKAGNIKGYVPELVVCLGACSVETFVKLKETGLKYSHFTIA